MLRVGLIAVGRLKAGAEREIVARYVQRFDALAPRIGLSRLATQEIEEQSARHSQSRRAGEARGLRKLLPEGGRLILFDERGRNLASSEFARVIGEARDAGAADLKLMIGGPDGVGAELDDLAPLTVALGAMTWPHQLVRIMVVEQLYRAATILSGHPYHRA